MRSTPWILAAALVLLGACASDAEPASEPKRAEEDSSEKSTSEKLAAREIPQMKDAFEELARRLVSMGEKPRKTGAPRAVSTEDEDVSRAAPKKRHTGSFTSEDVDSAKKETWKTMDEAKKHLLAMSGTKKDAGKTAAKQRVGRKMGVISYVVLIIAALAAAVGAGFFIWMLVMNK